MTDDLVKRMDAARLGPHITTPTSRHAAMLAVAMMAGTPFKDLNEQPGHAGESIGDTVAHLWESLARIESLEADNARLRHAALVREERIAELERHFQEAVSEVSQAGRKQGEAEGALVAAQVKMSEAMTAIAMASNRLDWCVDTSAAIAEIEDAKQSAEASVVRQLKAFVTRDMPKDGEG